MKRCSENEESGYSETGPSNRVNVFLEVCEHDSHLQAVFLDIGFTHP